MSTLAADSVHFAYRESSPVLQGASLRLGPGELVALVGPNGSGKSTLLRVAVGLLRPQQGEVRLDDRPVTELSSLDRARRVAFLPQRVRPLYDMPVRGIVELARHPHQRGWAGALSAEDRSRVDEAMDSCAVYDLRDRSFATLSGGERQRVLLAAALAQSSKALVLDEPTTALDPHHQVETFQHLREVAEAGAAVLVATHDLNLAATFADRLLLLEGGRVALDGDPAAVLSAETLERVFGPGLRVGAHDDGTPWVLPHVEKRAR